MSLLCNWRKLHRAVEVGVDRGEFALAFLDRWMGSDWWGIDPYLPYGRAATGGMPHDREADFLTAVHRLAPHGGRAKLMRMGSLEASRLFAPESLDFVYVDGDHEYASVVADLAAWWPRLSERGILAGHDWTDQDAHEGVRRAVTEFAAEVGRDVYLTLVEGYNPETCPSWYLYRSGIPGADWRRC